MEPVGYALAFVMGSTLGLIGAGGSILTVPILVYFLHIPPVMATGYSLLVVGAAALMGAITYWRRGCVDLAAAVTFAIPATLVVLATRAYLIPALPDPIFHMSKDTFIMLLFADLMLLAAVFMIFQGRKPELLPPATRTSSPKRLLLLVTGSAIAGLLTGMIGAGGGFLIIPILIFLFGLSMKTAVGTSLAIIAFNSLIGFNGDVAAGIAIDWTLIGIFLAFTLSGMAVGTYLSQHIEGAKLKYGFGLFVSAIGTSILIEQAFKLLHPAPS